MDLLLVIDFQNAFINDNTKMSLNDIPKLVSLKKYDKVLFTRYINDESNPTYTKLNWKGCISKKDRKICMDTMEYDAFDKRTYSVFNDELKIYLKENKIENIYLCGIDIECCVLVTALNLFENGYNVYVLKDYVYSMHGEDRKNSALEILKSNIGKNNVI